MFHPSRIFCGLLIVFLISVAYCLNTPTLNGPLIFLLLAGFFGLIFWKRKFIRIIFLLLFTITLAIYRVQSVSPTGSLWINALVGEKGTFTVRIIEEPKTQGKAQQLLARARGYRGNIQIVTEQFPSYRFGDTLELKGEITGLTPESEQYRGYFRAQQIYAFSKFPEIKVTSQKYTLSENIYFLVRKPLIELRIKYERVIGKILPEPAAGLLAGILLGSRANLSKEFLTLLSITGTIHIIALSGYNITIVIEFMRLIAKNLSRHWSFWLPMFGILAFILATGLSASAIRAGIMGALMLVSHRTGRPSSGLISILFASSLMVFINPNILLYDVGFQLSFAAVTGIIFLAPKLERYFSVFGRTLGPILAATFSAQIFSLPITSYYFGVVSIISPLANALIIPLVPIVMLIGFVAATVGLVSLWLGGILAFPAWLVLGYMNKVVEYLGSLSFASSGYQVGSVYFIIGYYLVIIEITMLLRRKVNVGKAETV